MTLGANDFQLTRIRSVLAYDHLLLGRMDAAREHFRWVKEHADRVSIERVMAVVELGRLDARPAPALMREVDPPGVRD